MGFTVKSGWASAVVVAGPASAPRVVDSRRVDLSDPAIPESRQPYHGGFGTARSDGPELSRLIASVEKFGRQSVTDFVARCEAAGLRCPVAGIVVGSLIDPKGIGNDHIRVHALEGQLFRSVVHDGAVRSGIACSIWRERDLYAAAEGTLNLPEESLRKTLAALGRTVSGSWRAEQKAAALAAWLVLAGAMRAARTDQNSRSAAGPRP